MLNNVFVNGVIKFDPKVVEISGGLKKCDILIAQKQQNGYEEQYNATIISKNGHLLEENLRKGRNILISGQYKTSSWKDDSGKWCSKTFISVSQLWFATELPFRDENANVVVHQKEEPTKTLDEEIDDAINDDDLPF